MGGISQYQGKTLLEFFRDNVLEAVSFLVDLIPGETHGFMEEMLQQAVVAQDLQGYQLSIWGEHNPAVFSVLNQGWIGSCQFLDHPGDRCRFDIQGLSDMGCRSTPVFGCQFINDFQVVFNRLGEIFSVHLT